MYFIDNIDTVFANLRKNPDFFNQVADIIHGVIGGCIQLMNIEGP
jgi:hypothetical protein